MKPFFCYQAKKQPKAIITALIRMKVDKFFPSLLRHPLPSLFFVAVIHIFLSIPVSILCLRIDGVHLTSRSFHLNQIERLSSFVFAFKDPN